MRKISYLLIALFSFSAFFGCANQKNIKKEYIRPALREYAPPTNAPRYRVAVTDFENATRFKKRKLGIRFRHILTTELQKTGRFILLNRAHMDLILKENPEGVAAADFIITGAVTNYSEAQEGTNSLFTKSKRQYANVDVDVQIVSTATGEIVFTGSGEGNSDLKRRKALGLGTSGGYDADVPELALQTAAIAVVEDIINALDSRR